MNANSRNYFGWDSERDWFPFWRNRDFLVPPLWHFHRILAGRRRFEDEDVNEIETSRSILEIKGLDYHFSENGYNHHTDKYELVHEKKALVLRKGCEQNVKLGISFKNSTRLFDPNTDGIRFIFEFGDAPSVPKGTKAVFQLQPSKRGLESDDNTKSWKGFLVKKQFSNRTNLEVELQVPLLIPVGSWNLRIETFYGKSSVFGEHKSFTSPNPIYIIFNPYNSRDAVHLPNSSGLEEYLNNDVGTIYGGSHNNVTGRPWIYGQFTDSILPACCHILDKILKSGERADVIKIVRAISAIVNSNDDNGILIGRWSGDYSDGTKPFEWTGSVPILEQFVEHGKSVKYGQCWVFAGVVTTICRALGIPCRPVTNYVSAHDTDGSFSIDKFYDQDGEPITDFNPAASVASSGSAWSNRNGRPDSIWNFHVWNEVWIDRHDLPKNFGGWQVIDATPQEQSDYKYQCGPAPVSAVRKGEVGMGFDVDFVFAEVNSDIFVFIPDTTSDWGYSISETNTDHVGKLIVTKSLGYLDESREQDYENITNNYKHKEGSFEERLVIMEAVKKAGGSSESSSARLWARRKASDVFMQMIDLDKGFYGKPFKASLYLHNQSSEERTVKVVMSTTSVYYTGIKAHSVKKGDGEFVLQPNERETLSMEVEPEEYMPKTVEYCQFVNRFLVNIRETGQVWSGEDDFILQKPNLQLNIYPQSPRVNRIMEISIKMTNPLNEDLTNCVITVEAPGVTAAKSKRIRKISANETVEAKIEVKPWRSGITTIVAALNSRELYNITGVKKINLLA